MTPCNEFLGREGFGDEPVLQPVFCLLPLDHDGPHADWTAWFGVTNPDFTKAGKSKDEA